MNDEIDKRRGIERAEVFVEPTKLCCDLLSVSC